MKCWILAALVIAGCSSAPEAGSGSVAPASGGSMNLKAYPSAGEWIPNGIPFQYSSDPSELDVYAGESRGVELRANGLDRLVVTRYSRSDRDARRIRVEIFAHQSSVGAGKTFQEWHRGASVSDVGEKAFAESDAIVFLRGSALVRLVPTGGWAPKSAGAPTLAVARAIDAWLQGK